MLLQLHSKQTEGKITVILLEKEKAIQSSYVDLCSEKKLIKIKEELSIATYTMSHFETLLGLIYFNLLFLHKSSKNSNIASTTAIIAIPSGDQCVYYICTCILQQKIN